MQPILKAWGKEGCVIRQIDRGYVNRNWIVFAEKKYVLREYASWRKRDDILEEMKWIQNLSRLDYDVPVAIENQNGLLYVDKGNLYSMYEYIEGEIREEFNSDMLMSYFNILDQFHGKIKQLIPTPRYGNTFLLTELIRPLIRQYETDLKQIDIDPSQIHQIVDQLGVPKKLEIYPIHRDLHLDNILWRGNEIVGILDFENFISGEFPLLKDLAITMQNSLWKGELFDSKLFGEYIKLGYENTSLDKESEDILHKLIISGKLDDMFYQIWLKNNDPSRFTRSKLIYYHNSRLDYHDLFLSS